MDLPALFSAESLGAARPWLLALGVIIAGVVVGRLLAAFGARLTRRTGSEHLAAVTQRLLFYAMLLVALFGALNILGIEPAALLTTAGLLTVAIGFAAQTSVANVISGVFLLIDRPFSINDMVMVEGTQGIVTGIDLLSTKIRTFDNLVVRFPNEMMLKATITNYALFTVRRIEQRVTVAYRSDLGEVLRVIEEALDSAPLILDEPNPFVLVDTLGDDGVVIVIRAWCDREEFIFARSALTRAVKEALQTAEIEIPFPQRVMHQAAGSDSVL